jgi:uncharacterized membrane protein
MSAQARPPQEQVDTYLARLRKALGGLPADDVEEILQELRGHIAERAAATDSDRESTAVEWILATLGTPEEIGSLYQTDAQLAHARATFSPALIIRTTIRWATKTVLGFVAFILGFTGYALGLSFIACALLKPFFPTHIGLWIHPHGIELATPNAARDLGPELLGWWIIPIGLLAGALFVIGTTVFLRWMLRFAPSASRRIASLVVRQSLTID